MRARYLIVLVAVALVAAPPASAAPANDDRANAAELEPPTSVTGTVVGATTEPGEPVPCGDNAGSVWYRFKAPADGRVIVSIDGAGNLDALVEVSRLARSQLMPVDCATTDRDGKATLDLSSLDSGGTYLIRVARRASSEENSFRLSVLIPKPAAKPPGRPLPRGGVTGSVDRLLNPSDAWSVGLRAGTNYRLNLDVRATHCVSLDLYRPGTRSFGDSTPVRHLACGGYRLITPRPGGSGRYILRVRALPRERLTQRYHLQVAEAGRDDTAPGIAIGNYRRIRGSLHAGGIDIVDLYRFDLSHRSALTLRLRTAGNVRLTLLNDHGKRLVSGGTLIRHNVRRGRYFVAVRSGTERRVRYVFSRVSRQITHARIVFNNARSATARPGATVRIGVLVTPAASGPVMIDVERFDPLAGWIFFRRFQARASNGRAVVSFRPPAVGRYRANALFLRTHTAAASATPHFAHLLVAGPLGD